MLSVRVLVATATLLGLIAGPSLPDPVIILPAFSASVLDATLDNAQPYRDCQTSSTSFNLYASAEQFTL